MRCTTLGLLWLPSIHTGSRAASTQVHLLLNIRGERLGEEGRGKKVGGLLKKCKKKQAKNWIR